MVDEKIWKTAQKHVAFKRHLLVYALVNTALIIIWFISRDRDKPATALTWWFLYVLCGWGIGLVMHYWNAYHDDDRPVMREYEKLQKFRENLFQAQEGKNIQAADKSAIDPAQENKKD